MINLIARSTNSSDIEVAHLDYRTSESLVAPRCCVRFAHYNSSLVNKVYL